MATYKGHTYVEHVPGSPEENFTNESAGATRVFDVDWETRFAFIQDVLGFATLKSATGSVTANYIAREIPMQYPDYPGMFATKVTRVEGIGFRDKDIDDQSVYERARCTVQFETLTYDVLDDAAFTAAGGINPNISALDESTWKRYVTKLTKPQADYLSLSPGAFKFSGGCENKEIQSSPGIIITTFDVSVTWHLVPEVCVPSFQVNRRLTGPDAIDLGLGTVNDDVFNIYPQETLLLLAVTMKPLWNAIGTRAYDVEFRFKYNPNGHNKIYCAKDGSFVKVIRLNDATKGIYLKSGFKPLFQPPKI